MQDKTDKKLPTQTALTENVSMTNTQPLYANPQTAMHVAEQVIETITQLHAAFYLPMRQVHEDARRRFCRNEEAKLSIELLRLSCSLSTLAQYAARMQEAAENKKYGPIFWRNRVQN